jgi:hypothetical protein
MLLQRAQAAFVARFHEFVHCQFALNHDPIFARNRGSDSNLMQLGRRLALNPRRKQPDVANPSSLYDCAAWISG